MKILLVAPPLMDYVRGKLAPISYDASRECPPYGLYLLASVMREVGYEVVVADLIADGSHRMKRYKEDLTDCSLVGIGATSLSWPTALDVISQIRRIQPEVPIVVGGIHATMLDKYILERFSVDYVIRGEAELALPALCKALSNGADLGTVPNLTWRSKDGKVVRNSLAPKIPASQLGLFPIPDFGALPRKRYKGLSIESSRGCPFDCSFCTTAYRQTWRPILPETFGDNLERMMEHVGRTSLNMIHIVDDEFSVNPRRAIEIAQIFRRRGLKPRLTYDSRVRDLLFDGYVENMREFTLQLLVGAECGYDEGLKRIGKGMTVEMIEDAARLLSRYDIAGRADFSFILGLPWEGRVEVEKTLRFAAHLFATYGVRILLQWYVQIPGSRLWEEAREAQIVHEAMYDDYGFFRNLYLFRTGVRLAPWDMWEIARLAHTVKALGWFRYPDRQMVEHALPEPIYVNFPDEYRESTALSNLREVSRPVAKGGLIVKE